MNNLTEDQAKELLKELPTFGEIWKNSTTFTHSYIVTSAIEESTHEVYVLYQPFGEGFVIAKKASIFLEENKYTATYLKYTPKIKIQKVLPNPGDKYKHYRGSLYTIITLAIDEEYTLHISYKGENNIPWLRTWESFNSHILGNHNLEYRFTKVQEC